MAKSKQALQAIFEKETTLKEQAKAASYSRAVPKYYPGGMGGPPLGEYPRITTPTTKAAVWGGSECLTLSLLKTDVIDRRFITPKPFTMADVIEGAYSEKNRDFNDMPLAGMTRPPFGVLAKEGGRVDYYKWSEVYPFPCQKPVGQIIVKAEDFRGAPQPEAVQSLKNGLTAVDMKSPGASMRVEYLMGMRRNIIAASLEYSGLTQPVRFRIYRQQDQGHRRYMHENGDYVKEIVHRGVDGKVVRHYDFAADEPYNRKFDPPEHGSDGRFFWIRQKFPAEPTFPEGFQYVMMGLVSGSEAEITAQGLQKGLGTPPGVPRDADGQMLVPGINTTTHPEMFERMDVSYSYVRNAPGVAETAELLQGGSGRATLYVAVVTLNETKDYFEEAKRQLLAAEALGFGGLAAENELWYGDLYERREAGRILLGAPGEEKEAVDRLALEDAFLSWTSGHSGYCLPAPSRYEGSASYAQFDVDTQSWHSLPCYNELFTEGRWFTRNRYEPKKMWAGLVTAWHEALKEKARIFFGLPGMTIAHGYLPAAKPHPLYIENECLDFCMEVPGQVMKVLWNLWDYPGDEQFLKDTVYPPLRDLAVFYEAFARRNFDGKYYNILPTVETESYGISYELKYTRNTTAALTLFRKTLNMACQAAELLGADADLVPGWREVAENLHPYPKFRVGSGDILGGNPGIIPRFTRGDHGIFSGNYPATLADEINLDSPREDRDLIIRTADTVRGTWNRDPYILVGSMADYIPCNYNTESIKIENYTQLTDELLEMPERLCNSRSGRIHLFPVVPSWSVVAFRGFLARGGFEVSAAKGADGVLAATVKARRSIPCRVMHPWKGEKVYVVDTADGSSVPFRLDTANGECIEFEALKGHEYSIDRV